MTVESDLRTIDEAAELLRVGRRTVERLIAEGELASLKIGRRRLVPDDAIARYRRLAERRGRVA